MTNPIRFCLVLHNHQPIGNFDHVFEQAYRDSYLPFLDTFEGYRDLRISLHTSGPLMEWLDEHHSDYVDRLGTLVDAGRIEILGGPYYEPILTMIPGRDRIGQIRSYADWLEKRFGTRPQGIWVPERVWEQSLTSDVARAGVKYTLLDDCHFRNAGLTDDKLLGQFVTEDDGRVLSIFPGSERLRYLIPFREPHETIDYLRHIADQFPNSVAVFGDDGEKLGTWPETNQHVYGNGWLRRFFDALVENQDWISTTTLADAYENTPPQGMTYLPDSSYREMTEWVLPPEQQNEFEDLSREMEADPRWQRIKCFVRGGFWRNFMVRYPESNEMYARMMQVSRRLEQTRQTTADPSVIASAQRELHRGQCNCSYWHGAFGGIYLPHLRNAVYNHLIAADNILDKAIEAGESQIDATVEDFNFDARPEVRLTSNKLIAFLTPATGGQIYELDVRSICHNLLATLTRRPEAYHRKVLKGDHGDGSNVASIHDRVTFKQDGLDQKVQYDHYARKTLIDHFFDGDATLEAARSGEIAECGDFIDDVFETKLRRSPDRVQVLMTREGQANGAAVKLTKGVTLAAGSSTLEIAYLLEDLPPEQTFHFGVEFNLAGLPAGVEDRFFYQGNSENRLGQLETCLDLHDVDQLGLIDQWLGLDVGWSTDRSAKLWTYPIETVSQSEGGFELVHQSVVLLPHWHVQGDATGRWAVTMKLHIDTSLAESRMHNLKPTQTEESLVS